MASSSDSATYFSKPICIFFFLVFFSPVVDSHSCSGGFQIFIGKQKITQHCQKLDTLGAELAWKYSNISSDNQTIDVIFAAPMHAEKGWIAWGINPKTDQMSGTNAIIGIKYQNGALHCNTYNLTRDTKLGCGLSPAPISEVKKMSFEYVEKIKYYAIIAKLVVSSNTFNASAMNMVWQVGFEIDGDQPKNHPVTLQNMDGTDVVNLETEKSYTIRHKKNHFVRVHGILNILGFGVLLPFGAIAARYLKHKPIQSRSWTGIHVTSQILGTILGFFGWVIGIWLGSASKNYVFPIHRILGIVIFSLVGAQMLSLLWKPKELDKYRKYWDMYHQFMGTSLLVISANNIFRGINILKPNNVEWKWAYIGILVALCLAVLVLEVFFWFYYLYAKKEAQARKQQGESDSEESVVVNESSQSP